VIEPIFEADFLPCSFGFRPRRSQHDALQVLIDEAWGGRRWVAESDISNCFGEIPHSGLMLTIDPRAQQARAVRGQTPRAVARLRLAGRDIRLA